MFTVQQAYPTADVKIIDYHSWYPRNIPYLRGGISIKSLLYDFRRINKYRRFVQNKLIKTDKQLYSADYSTAISFIDSFGFDKIFVGADTLLELHKVNDGITAYWLSAELKCQKYLLAASARNVTFDSLTTNQIELIRNTVSDYSLAAVRDDATYQLIRQFIPDKKKLFLIPDPTFILSIDYSYVEKYIKKRKIDFLRPTICLHLIRTDTWGEELAKMLKKKGYQIASFRPNRYSDIILNDLSPLEQLGIYRYFKLMITHRFHDTIFCLKNNTAMITYPFDDSYTTENGDSKYFSLLNSFGLVETNYIKRKADITASKIFSMVDDAIYSFEKNKEYIERKLTDNASEYNEFISKSKLF